MRFHVFHDPARPIAYAVQTAFIATAPMRTERIALFGLAAAGVRALIYDARLDVGTPDLHVQRRWLSALRSAGTVGLLAWVTPDAPLLAAELATHSDASLSVEVFSDVGAAVERARAFCALTPQA